MASLRKRGNVWHYRFIDADGDQRERRGCSDKRKTEQLAAAAEAEVARIRAGLVDARDLARLRAEARPIAEHLADWRAYLLNSGATQNHARLVWTRAARSIGLMAGCDLAEVEAPNASAKARARAEERLARTLEGARLSLMETDRAAGALATLHRAGKSTQTVNHHRAALRNFSRWLWRIAKRTREDLLVGLENVGNPEADRRHQRRALTPEEATRLVAAAERGPAAEGLTGTDRAMAYRLAISTGFRADELRSLTPASFRLEGERATVLCGAADTKNGRDAEQPIPAQLVAILRPWLASKSVGHPVLPLPRVHTARMLRDDLAAAGIPYRDADGRVADFHSLRATYVSSLIGSGATIKTVQTLARHASPATTLKHYAKVQRFDLAAAVDALPDLTASRLASDHVALPATGTDGRISDSSSLPLPYDEDSIRQAGALACSKGEMNRFGSEGGPPNRKGRFFRLPRCVRPPMAAGGREPGGEETKRRRADSNCRITVLQTAGPFVLKCYPTEDKPPISDRSPLPVPYGDAGLVEVASAWRALPDADRSAILAIVRRAALCTGHQPLNG